MDIEKIYQEWIKTVLGEDFKTETFLDEIDESTKSKKKIKIGVLDLETNRMWSARYDGYIDKHGRSYLAHRKGRMYSVDSDIY